MQKTILLFLCLFSFVRGYGQIGDVWDCTFEHPHDTIRGHLFIDTTNYKHNIWQIGRPQKNVCDSASSIPNAIVTDTLNPYPANDTSVFIIRHHFPSLWGGNGIPILSFDYLMQKDSGDNVTIEYSIDTGKTWKDITKHLLIWSSDSLRLDTSTSTWVHASIMLMETIFSQHSDSISYRFTFISDSVDTHKDGWAIDNILLEGYWEGITNLKQDNTLISMYPNPCTNDLYIKSKKIATHTPQVSIYDALGRQLYNTPLTTGHIPINLPDGTYVLRYITDDAVAQKRFVVHK